MDSEFTKENVLEFIGYHKGARGLSLAGKFGISLQEASDLLFSLYSEGLLDVFVSFVCCETGHEFSVVPLKGESLDDFVYECEDMDGECVFCGGPHSLKVEDGSLFFTIREEFASQYPPRNYPRRETSFKEQTGQKIEGLVAQIDEMHKFIIQLQEGAAVNRYTSRVFIEQDPCCGDYYVGPAGKYWREVRKSKVFF